MRVYARHPEQLAEFPASTVGVAHTGQSFIGDFVRTCRSRSYYLHIRGVTGWTVVITGNIQIVAVRAYRVCYYVVVGRGLAMVF